MRSILLMIKRIFFLFTLLIISFTLDAQNGAPLLTHFRESREIENQSWAICQDINQVMLFANRKGILTFDGQDWVLVRIPTIPFSMSADPKSGKIFIGGEDSYGYFHKDQSGLYEFVPISGEASDLGVITKIVFKESEVWFYGDHSVSCHNIENNTLDFRIKSDVNNPFTGILVTPENVFINLTDKGLFKIDNDTLIPVPAGSITSKVDILFSLPYGGSEVLVGLSNGNLALFDGYRFIDYQIKDDGYLKDNILSEGITIGDSLYAFSTLDGGALVINRMNGTIRYTINNQNDLPDDEVLALGLDRGGGLWLSHQFGITRADLSLPVGNFSIYEGLMGNLTNTLWHNNELYVATSEGVFYLTEVKNYSEVQVLIKNEPQKSSLSDYKMEIPPEQRARRENIFTRIFGRKSARNKLVAADNILAKGTVTEPGLSDSLYTKRIIHKLKSINYIYKKVEGLNEKCRQLVSTPDGILAATNKGLLVINNHRASVVSPSRYINFITWQPESGKYYVAAGDGYFSLKYFKGKWLTELPDPLFTDPVYAIVSTDSSTVWLGVDNSALRVNFSNGGRSVKYTKMNIVSDFPQRYLLDYVNDSLYLFTESGIYTYDNITDAFRISRTDTTSAGTKMRYLYPLSNIPWIKHGDEWFCLNPYDKQVDRKTALFKIFNDVVSVSSENNFLWVVDDENRLFRLDISKQPGIYPEIDVLVKSIYDDKGTTFNLTNIVFKRGANIFNFDIVAPGYLKQNTTQYQYTISKLMTDWSPWSVQTKYNLIVSAPGEYTLQVRAKDLWGNIGKLETVKFTIKAPFTKTTVFYLLCGSVIFLLLIIIVRFRESQLHKKNLILEEKVRERTAEIETQKEEITSSIEYASRIQRAMLPVNDHFKACFSDYFVIFRPRDIVSGDFYWIGEVDKRVFFTVADCTGHGVPGAFMSTLGISALNEIITNNTSLHANTVLNLLREKIKTSLHQTGKEGEAADGMDISFCVLNKLRKTLQFSGANNSLFIFQNGELKEYKGDRMPIGIYYGEEYSFTNYEIICKKGDTVYIFSDGYTDQFGGREGSKYKKSNLRKLLSGIYYRPMAEQHQIIENELENWKGTIDQVDDITMIGVRI